MTRIRQIPIERNVIDGKLRPESLAGSPKELVRWVGKTSCLKGADGVQAASHRPTHVIRQHIVLRLEQKCLRYLHVARPFCAEIQATLLRMAEHRPVVF